MKKRWMKSIIEASKSESPDMPFHRGNRMTRDLDDVPQVELRKTA